MAIHKTREQLISEVEALRQEVMALKQLVRSPFSLNSETESQSTLKTSPTCVNSKEYTIVVVEDSETDCTAYRQYLTRNCQDKYHIIEFHQGEDALIWCQQRMADIFLIDFFLPDMDGLEFLQRLYQQTNQAWLPVIMITGQGNTDLAVDLLKKGAQDYLVKDRLRSIDLQQAIANVLRKGELIQAQAWQQKQQQLVTKTALSIRNSLKLEDILHTAVTEIREILQSDRVIIYQLQPDYSGVVITESVIDTKLSIIGQTIIDNCFEANWVEVYSKGRISAIDDIYTKSDLTPCHQELLASFQVRANLVIPIIQNDNLWGLLIAHQCNSPRHWTNAECELMNQLAIQMGIAIQQANLFEKLQTQLIQHQKLVSIIENCSDFIATANLDGQVQYINPAGKSLIGLENIDVQQTSIWQYQAPEVNQIFQQEIIPTVVATGRWQGEFQMRHFQTQELISVWCNIFTLNDLITGQPHTIATVTRDIRERKQAEANLKQMNNELELRVSERAAQLIQANNQLQEELWQRERLERELKSRENLLDSFFYAASQVNIGLGITDHKFHFLKVNQALANINGHSIKSHIGKSFLEIIPEIATTILPLLENVMATQQPISNMEISGVVPSQPGIVRHWLLSYFPILGELADAIALGCIVLEISDRKLMESKLKQLVHRWHSLQENVQLIVISLNSQGQVEYANPFFLQLTGYTQTEVIGKNWFENFLPEDIQNLSEIYLQGLLENNIPLNYQNYIVTKSGVQRLINWNNTILNDVNSNPIGTISIGEDITERYRLEQLETEFVSIVSHELRTPLTSMQAALSLLHEKIIDPNSPEGETTIAIATNGVDHLVHLVNDILDLQRLESGKISLEKCYCNTANIINNAIAQMQTMAEQAGIKINATPVAYQIYADPDRVLQVIINLLSNAIKFSDNGGNIWLDVDIYELPDDRELIKKFSSDGNYQTFVVFAIRDTGRGIPKDYLDKIFEPFIQVDASDSRAKGGTGLGLTICRNIIQQHGGNIWVESILGQGSTFYLSLPTGELSRDNQKSFNH